MNSHSINFWNYKVLKCCGSEPRKNNYGDSLPWMSVIYFLNLGLLQGIMYHHIVEYLNNNNILINEQYDFRAGHSCETQLLRI